MRSPRPFEFMHWAKEWVGSVPYCFGASGVAAVTPQDFPPAPAPYAEANVHGTEELRRAIAEAQGVGPDSVLVSQGTSLANYTALAVLAGPGDRILVERPTYPVLEEIPRFHRATVERLERRPEDGWGARLDEVREHAGRTDGPPLRAVVLTRLHNPSGLDLPVSFLNGLARLADRYDFHVLLDEVYLDFLRDAAPGHSFSPRFVSTGSLTKVYGFGGLRVGWVVGDPRTLTPMKELSYYLAVDGSSLSQATACRVFEQRDRFLERAWAMASTGAAFLGEWIGGRDDVEWTRPDGGINGFVRLTNVPDTAAFAEELRRTREVNIAEGEFFDMPGWTRLSFGLPEETLREGLRRLGEALEERR